MAGTTSATNEQKTTGITLSDEQRAAFVRSVKIAYFREFYKQGLISSEQLALLIRMQDTSENSAIA